MILTFLHMWAVAMVIVMMTTPSAGEEGEPECGDLYNGRGNMGEIESPGYPSNYPNNVRCGYHLSTEQGGTIELRFTDFYLEPHRKCDWDYVQVYDGSTSTGSLIIEKRLCGYEIPATIHSTLDSMYVLFVTDYSVQHKGFHAVWSANAPVTTTAPPKTVSLVGGTPYSGKVLVTSGGKTGYVCDRNFTKQDADVVCRMLGYSESYKRYSSNSADFTDPSTQLWLFDLHCHDHGRDLFQCPYSVHGTECSLDDVASVECYELPTVSLVGGSTNKSGTVVMTANGHANAGVRGPICSIWWGVMEGNVVCRMLGYSGASSVSRYNHYNYNSSSPFMLDGIICRGNESHIMDCPVESFPFNTPRSCTTDDTAGVQCYDVDDTPIDAAGCGLLPLIGNGETDTDFWPQICNITASFAGRYSECVGTLVKNSHGNFYLVTLASCVYTFPEPDFYRATCGKINTNGDSYLQVLQFKQITRHPGYGNNRGEDNDIAVLSFMFQPVENDYVQAACIAHEDHVDGEVGTVVDWSQYYEDYNPKYTLLQLNLTILPDEHCTTDDFNKYSNICTGTVESEHHGEWCVGFHGSPMFTNRGGKWTLTGIRKKVYNNGPCSDSQYIITDVYDMRVWLDQQIHGCY